MVPITATISSSRSHRPFWSQNQRVFAGVQLLVPKGFAHGFVTLTERTEVAYKVTDYYSAEQDRSIRFDDPDILIDWPVATQALQLSDKDLAAPRLAEAEVF